jgi:hypothetical protein
MLRDLGLDDAADRFNAGSIGPGGGADPRSARLAWRAKAEMDRLVAELSGAVGLGGRSRRALDTNERARKAVSTRITLSIRRIEDTHSVLGRHLRHSIRTGTLCRYQPEHTTSWELQA